MSSTANDFVRDSGACVVSLNVMNGVAPLRWLVRDTPNNASDNGWRFFSAIDDEAYLDDPKNLTVATFNSVAAIEPAVIAIYKAPVGTDLELVREHNGAMFFRDNNTGARFDPEQAR